MPQGKLTAAICREVVQQLESAQENRQVEEPELELLRTLKLRILGLAAIEKSRPRQKSRIIWLRKGDANTKYFQAIVNISKKKNFIHMLHHDGGIASTQKDKHEVIFQHYLKHIGTYSPRGCQLNFQE